MISHLTLHARRWALVAVLAVAGFGCDSGNDHGHDHPHPGEEKSAGEDASHGDATDLGRLQVAGREFKVVRFGEVTPGKESAFEVEGVGISNDQLAKLNLYLWVEDESGAQLSAPAKGDREGVGLHFHVTPRAGKGDPYRVVLRLRSGDTDERTSLPLSGSGSQGFLELKLHDDKGDLELWLAKDEKVTEPFDLPLASEIQVEFIDVGGRTVTLRPRNQQQNEDEGEDGKPNIRNGETNYFIYPTAAGEDASWLQGKEFSSIVVVSFTADGQPVKSEEFVLKPHEH